MMIVKVMTAIVVSITELTTEDLHNFTLMITVENKFRNHPMFCSFPGEANKKKVFMSKIRGLINDTSDTACHCVMSIVFRTLTIEEQRGLCSDYCTSLVSEI
jgi:hypothetical protein